MSTSTPRGARPALRPRTGGPGGPAVTTGSDRPDRSRARSTAWGLAAAVIAVQITYPLLSGPALAPWLTASTIATVVLFAAASLVSAAASHGLRAAATLLLVAGAVGLGAESLGVATGFPFGAYAYAGTLGPQVAGVPVIIPLAWTMMAWPTLLAGRAVAAAVARRRPGARWARAGWLPVLPAAWALAAWDLYLDPQMVAAGHWSWRSPTPALPGVPGIPLTNFAGWLLVAMVMQALLHAVVGGPRRDRRPPGTTGTTGTTVTAGTEVWSAWPARTPGGAGAGTPGDAGTWGPPALLLGWTWLGSGLASLVFFSRPGAGLWGLAAMGVVVGPYLATGLRVRAAAR